MASSPEPGELKPSAVEKTRWPLWKKLAVVGITLIIVIPLAVGLGVGLTQRGSGDGGDDGDDDADDGDSGDTPSRESLWEPEAGASWQIVLLKPISDVGGANDNNDTFTPDVDIYDLDLFDNEESTFEQLHDAGKHVICYFSAGSYEDWRDDEGEFDRADLGKGLDGWEGERWINVSSENVRSIMKKRIELAAKKGCDAIDPDNVDGYQNDNGLGLTQDDAISFVQFLAETAGAYNMSTGLKNAGDIIPEVLDSVHFSVNEQCVEYSECETFAAFIEDGKPVFHIEYPDDAPEVSSSNVREICSHRGKSAGAEGFSTVIKKMNLDGWVEYCDGEKATTAIES